MKHKPAYALLVFLLVQCARGYNIDETSPVIKLGDPGSLFGLEVQMHHRVATKITSLDDVQILIGAPLAIPSFQPQVGKTGAIFNCSVSTGTGGCDVVKIDVKAERDEDDDSPPPLEGQWLGVQLKSEKPGGEVMTCAHRYNHHNNKTSIRITGGYVDALYGKCFSLDKNLVQTSRPIIPCQNQQPKITGFKYCQAGTSITFGASNNWTYFGMPGAYTWTGTVGAYHLLKDLFENAGTQVFGQDPLLERKIPKNSYVGFSISSGKLDNRIDPEDLTRIVAVGAPRLNDSGGVLIFKNGNGFEKLSLINVILGDFPLSAFGYAVEMTDINGDGRPDIIVGAPQYYDKLRGRGGAVYIFLNKAIGQFGPTADQVLFGESGSSFGMSITSCGDLDQDGVNDLAIGAPGAEGGTGAVYVYQGVDDPGKGVQQEPSQVIYASKLTADGLIKKEFKGFGYSLSGGLDMDLNGYPDLLVGSLSDAAVLYRSRPIIDITAQLTTSSGVIQLSAETRQQLEVKVCMNYNCGIDSYDEALEIAYKVSLDNSTAASEKRLSFKKDQMVTEYASSLRLRKKGRKACETLTTFVSKDIYDKLSPIAVLLTYEIKESTKRSKRAAGSTVPPSLAQRAILNAEIATIRVMNFNISKNCGDDDICRSELLFDAEYVEYTDKKWIPFPLNSEGVPVLYTGKKKTQGIRFNVRNDGEDAHQANLVVTLPPGMSFTQITPNSGHDYETNKNANNSYIINFGNPFKSGAADSFVIEFESDNGKLIETDDVETKLEVETSSTQDGLKSIDLAVVVIVEANFTIHGTSKPYEVKPAGEVVGESKLRGHGASLVGEEIAHIYEFQNLGTTPLYDLEFEVSWPFQLENAKWVFYFLGYEATYSDSTAQVTNCTVPEEYAPLNITEEKKKKKLRRRRDVEPELPSTATNQTVATKSTSKRVDIVCPGYPGCKTFTCSMKEIAHGSRVFLKLKAVVWNGTFLEEFNQYQHKINVASSCKWKRGAGKIAFTNDSILVASTSIDVIPDTFTNVNVETNYWIIAAAGLAGIVLLVLLILILWRCGFFRRRRDFGGYHKARYHKQASKKAEESATQNMLYDR